MKAAKLAWPGNDVPLLKGDENKTRQFSGAAKRNLFH